MTTQSHVYADFADRHIGPRANDLQTILDNLGYASLTELAKDAVPTNIQNVTPLALDQGQS